MNKLRMWIAWLRGATVLVPPSGVGYAAMRSSYDPESVDRWAAKMRADGWTDWRPL